MSEDKHIAETSYEDLEDWEDYGFDSKEEYEEYLRKCDEDPLFGHEALVSITEMKKLLRQQPYVPKGVDKNYPPKLLFDKKTGLYYTDFFRDFRQHVLLDHILAVLCIECENLDWERVTGGYSPYCMARINDLCLNPLEWQPLPTIVPKGYIETGRTAIESFAETPYADDALWDFAAELQEKRAVWFAEHLPTGHDLYALHAAYQSKQSDMIQWNIITTDYSSVDISMLDENDPYHLNNNGDIWNIETLEQNLNFIKEHNGYPTANHIYQLLCQDWSFIEERHLFDIDKLTDKQREDFKRFLFNEMAIKAAKWYAGDDAFISLPVEESLNEPSTEEVQEAPQKTVATKTPNAKWKAPNRKPTTEDIDEAFCLRLRRSNDYSRFLDFLYDQQKHASNGDWARYALTLYEEKVLFQRPRRFKHWLAKFCWLFDREFFSSLPPNKLKRVKCEKNILIYLPPKVKS